MPEKLWHKKRSDKEYFEKANSLPIGEGYFFARNRP
jgi:hypothetical protein